nr:hypothetical protein [uncultured Cohaesibacter sp.]
MALQRCIWSCLSAFPPATNPKYHACVDRQCNGMEEAPARPIQRGQRGDWSIYKLSKEEPPYLDGYAANTQSSNGKLRLSYVCGKNGNSYLSMAGTRVDALSLAVGASKQVTFSFDRTQGMRLDFGEYEGALISGTLSSGSRLLAQLQRANRLNVRFDSHFETFSLKGSSWALTIALDYCR